MYSIFFITNHCPQKMSTTLPSSFQPLQGFPNNAASHDQPSSNSSSSDSSYAHVFIVLAIILVVSVIGCVFGRLFCKGESSKPKQMNHVRPMEKGQPSSSKRAQDFPGNRHEDEDIEFGFDKLKPIPSSKVSASERDDFGGGGGGGGGLVGFKPVARNGEARANRGYVRFAPGGDIDSKPPGPGPFR
ncbi:hypothetical protein LIER_42887 [Lithospermum erythrorhizon]|uniref:Transmembrane protein n=1 Tax=Lithospermum erythrorhizon TaxID=34254 RepID=A0AAV3P7F2_LITER